MYLASCENEQAVAEAVRSDRWTPRLRAHTAECPVCAEVALVAQLLRQEDELARVKALLPNVGQIWRKAQIRSRQEAAEKAVQPIAVAERIGYASGILALVAVLAWRWPQVLESLDRLSARWANAFASDHWPGEWNLVLAVSTAAFLLFIGLAGYLVHTED